MAEWLYEAGIGEMRAALVEHGAIVEARIERDDGTIKAGTVLGARLFDQRDGRVALDDGGEALLNAPAGVPQGGALTVEIVREALTEPGRLKPPRAVPTDATPRPGPTLLERITATGQPTRTLRPHEPDALEEAGWSEVLEQARTGDIAFPGGMLRMIPTPAMTLFDVDGPAPLEPLALAAATAIGRAIRRHDVAGSIGIDFPTLAGKGPRQAVAAALDAALVETGPFERTTVNGFGFLQVIRRRVRASLPELVAADPATADALALLRSVERTPPPVPIRHTVSPAILARLMANPIWTAELSRRTGIVPIFEAR